MLTPDEMFEIALRLYADQIGMEIVEIRNVPSTAQDKPIIANTQSDKVDRKETDGIISLHHLLYHSRDRAFQLDSIHF